MDKEMLNKFFLDTGISCDYGRLYTVDMMDVGPGWYELIHHAMCGMTIFGAWDGSVRQIKEKFGGLRFYTGPLSCEAQRYLDDAERLSLFTCEKCGEQGHQHVYHGWVQTLCDKHIQEREEGS
jgi:hypothetical protein